MHIIRNAFVALLSAATVVCAQEKKVEAAPSATAAPTAVTASKPAWLTEVSLNVKEAHDDNLLMVSGWGMPTEGSWYTVVTPKVGVDLAPLLGAGEAVKNLTLAYAPDFAFYHQVSSENNIAHRVTTAMNGKSGKVSYSVDNAFVFIDGKSEAPIYTGLDGNRSAYATGGPRERRQQAQDRAKVWVRYDEASWFVRPCATLLDYDLMTRLSTVTGYQNYADRYDLAAGADLGWKVQKQLALTVGYRAGYQYQQQFPNAIDSSNLSSSSYFQRVLVGVEGKPFSWLTVAVQGGPDFRNYLSNSALHTTPIGNPDLVKFYGEGSMAAEITAKDSLTFKYKDWQWVSSTGKIAYYEGSHELGYRRKVTSQLTVDVSGKYGFADYNSGNVSSSRRYDKLYAGTVAVGYVLNKQWSGALSYTAEFGRNAQDGITNAPYREFNHRVMSASVLAKF